MTAKQSRPRRLRRWFFAGFAIVFVGMLLFTKQYFYTGMSVMECKLWRFYLLEMQRASIYPNALGPTSGSGMQALIVFATHLVASAVGGFITMGVRAFARRSRSQND